MSAEKAAFEREVAELEEFWKQPRFARTKRPYTAAQVVSKRGTVRIQYPSDVMAKKLWALLEAHSKSGTPSHTYGALDPVQVTQMAKHLETVYVSGWQSSSTASSTNEPGPDLADYPSNTVPNKVEHLFYAQLFHDRKQRSARAQLSEAELANTPYIDYLRPLIADGDTGHGGLTALVKMFVEKGAAGIHIEDQRLERRNVDIWQERCSSPSLHISRLVAMRLQLDIMHTSTLVIARTDSEAATLITSPVDPRDHPFILGATNPACIDDYAAGAGGVGLVKAMIDAEARGLSGAQLQAVEDNWINQAGLKTFSEVLEANKGSFETAVQLAQGKYGLRTLPPFSWDAARTREGFYRYRGGTAAAIVRAAAFAPHADLLWMETKSPILAQAKEFAKGVHAIRPGHWLAYNLSPSFNWDAAGLSTKDMQDYVWQLGKLGFVWQFITLGGLHSNAYISELFAKAYAKEGMKAYVELVQRRERDIGCDVLTHQKWSGADYVDSLLMTATGGISSTAAMGKGVTESQFATKGKL
ncbi:isocitrate lyase [Rhizoctonia solani]|uniref:Isocitrate lyase n=1 Tax=Rhizoctonia solani TaxID=456999 RepID=A0A8H8P8K8_9AGAM|nr:isocitrate lyase [Rhizoctonia solani]QRW27514.1 isocitrate lyase [Rhizoctonia solani]